jgi:hypothetical protein
MQSKNTQIRKLNKNALKLTILYFKTLHHINYKHKTVNTKNLLEKKITTKLNKKMVISGIMSFVANECNLKKEYELHLQVGCVSIFTNRIRQFSSK